MREPEHGTGLPHAVGLSSYRRAARSTSVTRVAEQGRPPLLFQWSIPEPWLWWLGVASVVMFAGTLMVIPWLVARIRPDYFLHPQPPPSTWLGRHPLLRLVLLLLKNLLGVVLIVAGLAMLVLPGQGILTLLFGLMLLNFPGKRRFEFWLVRQKGVLKSINWIRKKAKQPPLRVYGDHSPPEQTPSSAGSPAGRSKNGRESRADSSDR